MATGKAKISLIDKSRETNGFGFYTPELNSGNVAGYNGISAVLIDNIVQAVQAVCLSVVKSASVAAFSEQLSVTPPTDGEAQNEKRLLVKYSDTVTGFKGRMEIPGFDIGTHAQDGTDAIDYSAGTMAALVTALEAGAVSRLGNPITVYSCVFVGRNS